MEKGTEKGRLGNLSRYFYKSLNTSGLVAVFGYLLTIHFPYGKARTRGAPFLAQFGDENF